LTDLTGSGAGSLLLQALTTSAAARTTGRLKRAAARPGNLADMGNLGESLGTQLMTDRLVI
jgi:hypothetical protein